MAQAQLRRRSADRSETAELNRAVDRGGGDCRRGPSAHAVAARRLPVCAATDDPAPVHRFDQICRANRIEHRLTKPNHPWTNGQVERMNRTLKEATVNRYHYDTHEQLRAHLADFVTAYNFARRLKILKGLSPYEYICNAWSKEPARFILDPIQQMPGLNRPPMAGFITERYPFAPALGRFGKRSPSSTRSRSLSHARRRSRRCQA